MKFWSARSDKKRELWGLVAMLVLFVAIRLPGLSLPYHQDEWKTAWSLKSGGNLSGLHHPPLTQIFYNLDNAVFGADHLRLLPFLFSIAEALILFIVLKNRVGRRAAFFGLGIFTICAYSVFASLMIDTDGAILPVFFLLAVYFYNRFKDAQGKSKYKWFGWLAFSLIAGFMTKLSFVIVIGTILLDLVIEHRKVITRKLIVKGLLALAGFFGLSIILVLIIHYAYPTFEIGSMISHAASYAHIGGRNYFQSMIQGVKSLYYLSPLLLIPLVFTNREVFRRMRAFYLYLILGFIFYFILFDFSQGALDKYLMFAIAPLAAISGKILADILSREVRLNKGVVAIGIILSLILFSLNFFTPDVIGLYPKTEWFSRVAHLKWNMLNPFTGGDGPLGFYVSFLLIGASFVLCAVLSVLALAKKQWRATACAWLVFIGIVYNAVFVEEMIYGKINGNAQTVLNATSDFINNSPQITKVITYNDSGAYELSKIGKYSGRFYAAPQFEDVHRKLFSEFEGEYLIVDVPHLYQSGFYGEFFSRCHADYVTSSGRIFGYVVSCPKSVH